MSRKFMVLFVWTVVSLVIALNSGSAQTPKSSAMTQITIIGHNKITITLVDELANLTKEQLESGAIVARIETNIDLTYRSTGVTIPAGAHNVQLRKDEEGNWRASFMNIDQHKHTTVDVPIHQTNLRWFDLLPPDKPFISTADLTLGGSTFDVGPDSTNVCSSFIGFDGCFGIP